MSEPLTPFVYPGITQEMGPEWGASSHRTCSPRRPVRTGGRFIRHGRYFLLQLAESPLTSRLLGRILGPIERAAWQQRRDATRR